MWTYYPELLERAVPRYTSYPTAVDFSPAVGMTEMAGALAAEGQFTRQARVEHDNRLGRHRAVLAGAK